MSYTNDREEMRKKITTLAVEGERLILLDNLSGPVGNDVLDMALTSTEWKDRLLGGNRMYDGPLHAVWFGTGNNIELRADTSRRVCHIRMESSHERPEERRDVTHKNLRAHVLANRGRLLSAALTILRGWVAAGRPKHDLLPWGSYEGWSDVVRESLVYAGLPDPGRTREALQKAADLDRAAMETILGEWEQLDTGGGMTTAAVVKLLKDDKDNSFADLRAAVEELCGKIDGRTLGNRLRHFKRRNIGGRMIDAAPGGKHGNRWRVVSVQGENRPPSPPRPAPSPRPPHGGEGGEGGHFRPEKNPQPRGRIPPRRSGAGRQTPPGATSGTADPLKDTEALLAAVQRAGWTEAEAVAWLEGKGEYALGDELSGTHGGQRKMLLDHLAGL